MGQLIRTFMGDNDPVKYLRVYLVLPVQLPVFFEIPIHGVAEVFGSHLYRLMEWKMLKGVECIVVDKVF